MKVLIVDDEPRIVSGVRRYFEQAGFDVLAAYDGPHGLSMALTERPDLVVLDLMLPGMDGVDVCRELRRESDVPIIMLTARVEEADKLIGLELGADDYVTKPFSSRELVARVRALLRRSSGQQVPPDVLRAGDLTLNRSAHTVNVGEQEYELTPMEFGLLNTLMSNPGRAYSRMELLERTQGFAYDGYERTVDVHIKNLRKKIEEDPGDPQRILTVFGVGYRFNPNA